MASIASTYDGPVRIAVIGGTGLSHLPDFTHVATLPSPTTPWGKPSSAISILHHTPSSSATPSAAPASAPTPIAFLARHGIHHSLAPHEVPSRANIAALRTLGVRTIIAFSAVGSLQEYIRPRDFLLPDQIIDRTKGVRGWTFFEDGWVGHIGFAEPFDAALAAVVRQSAHALSDGVTLHDRGTLICMEGPQFSTRAESLLYRSWGASVINMSALPEAKLAREAEIGYQMICMATDYDCWHGVGESVNVEMVMGHMRANAGNARALIASVLDELTKPEHRDLVEGKRLEGESRKAAVSTAVEARSQEAGKRLEWLFGGKM